MGSDTALLAQPTRLFWLIRHARGGSAEEQRPAQTPEPGCQTSAPTGDLRALAIKVLAASGLPNARDALVHMVAPRRTLLGVKLPPKSAEMLAAVAALRDISDDPRARRILDLAAKAKDEDIVRAARGT